MRKKIIFTILFVLGLAFIVNSEIYALTVVPAKMVLSGNPGDTIETTMKIRNDLDRSQTFSPAFERFATKGDEPIFVPEKTDLASWITTEPSSVTLGPQETAEIKITINIPKEAEPGGHYAAIWWAASFNRGEGGVSVVTRVGSLVLLDVSGNVITDAELINFTASNSKKIFTRLPVGFSYALKNNGTVHIIPTGKLVIKNILGMTSAVLDVNPAQKAVLPAQKDISSTAADTERGFSTANWEPEGGFPKIEGNGFWTELKREMVGFALGYYRADLTIEYGENPIQTKTASYGFWVFPWRVLIFAIIILGIILWLIIRGIVKYNEWVIKKARESLSKK